MPNLKFGNMFNQKSGIIFVTGNATLKNNGALVMGHGAALELKNKSTGMDKVFGKRISEICGTGGKYYLIVDTISGYGLFQVKYNWCEMVDIDLIKESATRLSRMANLSPYTQYHLNYPGIGNGKSEKLAVESAINLLPQNVTLWEK